MKPTYVVLSLILIVHSVDSKRIIRVLSDTHIGGPRFSTDLAHQTLASFIESTILHNQIQGLIFLGDSFEQWLFPFDQYPPSPDTLLSSNNSFNFSLSHFESQVELIVNAGVPVTFVQGNHDDNIFNSSYIKYLPNVTFVEHNYTKDHVIYFHGHEQDLFNAPDPTGIRPVGYYVTRAQASQGTSTGFTGNEADTLPQLCGQLSKGQFGADLEQTLKNSDAFLAVLKALFALIFGTVELPE
jgi:UDP-2,3-diacylglucosamine pyrophosphatase LpxH